MAVAVATKKRWTLGELHSLPDDGNKYELIRGVLFVTPPPTDEHETIAARLTRLLDPFVERNGLGYVYHPKSVFRYRGSEVEPDLMVRAAHANPRAGWDKAPKPLLIVEIASPSTWRRDREHKREFYLYSRIPEYWMIDPDERVITVVVDGKPDVIARDTLTWSPPGCNESLKLSVRDLFG
jgi:Uma2 family endonuclease